MKRLQESRGRVASVASVVGVAGVVGGSVEHRRFIGPGKVTGLFCFIPLLRLSIAVQKI
ncbi:MAG TPA: hypothetical protein VF043_09210 [Ktedonobacteraceae bacterium]